MALKLVEFSDQLMVDFLEKSNPISVNWIEKLIVTFTVLLIDS